jgi:hypothetical protein
MVWASTSYEVVTHAREAFEQTAESREPHDLSELEREAGPVFLKRETSWRSTSGWRYAIHWFVWSRGGWRPHSLDVKCAHERSDSELPHGPGAFTCTAELGGYVNSAEVWDDGCRGGISRWEPGPDAELGTFEEWTCRRLGRAGTTGIVLSNGGWA